MKRSTGILLGLALLGAAGLAQARGGGGGHGGGGHSSGAMGGHAAMGGHFTASGATHFTTGPTHFTTGAVRFIPGGRPVVGIRPGPVVVGRPFHRHNGVIVGGAVVLAAPFFWYPPPPYPYYGPAYADPAYAQPQTYVEQGQISYYCPDYQDYYPNVPSCPSAWVQVVPDTGAYPAQ